LAKADRKLSYSAMLLYVFSRRFELIDHQTYIRAPVHAVRGITHQINADTCLGYPLSRTSALSSHLTILRMASEISQVLRFQQPKAPPGKDGLVDANDCHRVQRASLDANDCEKWVFWVNEGE
jgi:hypothetical protein